MTSDAKIGLLLGLVFIFIIAFIINGLPKLRGQTDSNELTTNMARPGPPGVGAMERRLEDEVFNRPPPQEDLHDQTESLAFDPAGTFSADNDAVRDRRDLPQIRPGIGLQISPGMTDFSGQRYGSPEPPKQLGPIADESSKHFIYSGAAEKRLELSKPELEKSEPPKIFEPTKTILPVKPPSPKTYLVVAGDNLGVIAKKVYGSEQGNRRVNVTRIFEANRKELSSPDNVRIGQKLVIPSLPTGLLSGLSGLSFERAKSVGQSWISERITPTASGGFYAVQEGDSLWKIAADKLGNGARWKEISKLNADTLPNEDDLKIGFSLKMPAK